MKKTALTFGLFSLAMVATSSATPTNQAIFSNHRSSIELPVDGATGGGRKQDRIVKNEMETKNNEFGFANINQSLGGNKKVD
jgi:hypothetical protein